MNKRYVLVGISYVVIASLILGYIHFTDSPKVNDTDSNLLNLPNYDKLIGRLLSIGGKGIEFSIRNNTLNVINNGSQMNYTVVYYNDSGNYKPLNCFYNALDYYNHHNNSYLCEGYALEPTGFWVLHAWCLNNNTLIETSLDYLAYYGIIIG